MSVPMCHALQGGGHGRPMSADVGRCRLMSADVGPCRPVSAHVGQCRSMSAHVGRCRPMSADVGPCRPMSAHVGRGWMSRVMWEESETGDQSQCGCGKTLQAHLPRISTSADVGADVSCSTEGEGMSAKVGRCRPMSANIGRCRPISADVPGPMSAKVGRHWPMSAMSALHRLYIGPCRPMPADLGPCRLYIGPCRQKSADVGQYRPMSTDVRLCGPMSQWDPQQGYEARC